MLARTVFLVACLSSSMGCGGKVLTERNGSGSVSDGSSSEGSGSGSDGSSSGGDGQREDEVACFGTVDEELGCPSFEDVFEVFTEQNDCAFSGCHGDQPSAALGVWIPDESPEELFDALVSQGLLDPDDPWSSELICGMHNKPQVDATGEDIVAAWLACGAPGPV